MSKEPTDPKLIEKQSKFFDVMERFIKTIEGSTFNDYDKTFKKVLYFNVIDLLSKSVYPNTRRNHDRFTEFVRKFCEWDNCDRVSLPHLCRLLEHTQDTDFRKLREYSSSKIEQWDRDKDTDIYNDPLYDEIKEYLPRDKNIIKVNGKETNVKHLKHVSLLYKLRNSLVHELRELGRPMEDSQDVRPYYHKSTHEDLELVYPVKFIKALTDSGLENLRSHFENKSLNPYDAFNFGAYWINVLNM